MHSYSKDEIIDAYVALGLSLKMKSGELHGACPSCGGEPPKSDRFWIGKDGVVGCRGCNDFGAIMKALGLSGKGDSLTSYGPSPEPEAVETAYGCTLAQYAEKVGLPEAFLAGDMVALKTGICYIKDIGKSVDCVDVPYLDLDLEAGTVKQRVKVEGKDKYRYAAGSKAALYGEAWLDLAKLHRKMIVVEGESDCHTMWFHNLPAVGPPGAGQEKVLEAWHFQGIDQIFVVKEAGEAGSKVPKAVGDRVRELGVRVGVMVLDLGGLDINELYQSDQQGFERAVKLGCRNARPLRESKLDFSRFVTAAEMLRRKFPPVRWIVPGILCEGLALIVAPPKAGKSFLALDVAGAVSSGAELFGGWKTKESDVLYIDLEEPHSAKKQARIRLLQIQSNRLTFIDRWPRIGDGCVRELDIYLESRPQCGLVVMDVWNKIKPLCQKGNTYDNEVVSMNSIKALADRWNVCILLLNHDKKGASATDVTEASSGSKAVTGEANVIWWLKRPIGSREGTMAITGRDVEEAELSGVMNRARWTFEVPRPEFLGAATWK